MQAWSSFVDKVKEAQDGDYKINKLKYDVSDEKMLRFSMDVEGVLWFEIGEAKAIGLDLVHDSMNKVNIIREQLLVAQRRKNAYANHRRRDLNFAIEDMVFLKVSPMRGTTRFGRRGKLSPRYIRPYEIIERVGDVAYQLSLLVDLEGVHQFFMFLS